MQLVLEQGSIDNPLNFDVALIQLSFQTGVYIHLKHVRGVFNPRFNVAFQFSQISGRFCTLALFILYYNYI